MGAKINIGDVWKDISQVFVNIGDVWKTVLDIPLNVGDTWKTGILMTVPTVTTASSYADTKTSAVSGGNVTADGGATVTDRGVCWNTTGSPTISDSHTHDSSGTGSFVSALSSLTTGTTYHVRAWATNSQGTAYGEEVDFICALVPTVSTTTPATNITPVSALAAGNITDDGGSTITGRGFYYDYDYECNSYQLMCGSGSGTFSGTIWEFTAGSDYFGDCNHLWSNWEWSFRAYATNAIGTSYGAVQTFTTLDVGDASVDTDLITNITGTTATSGGHDIVSGGRISNEYASIVEKGICWSTSSSPTTSNSKTSFTYTNYWQGCSNYSPGMTGLSKGTTYYVRAYVINKHGTFYGTERSFSTFAYWVGDSYQGGKIYYVGGTPASPVYYIAADSDVSYVAWGCIGTNCGASCDGMGGGDSNTDAAVASCSTGIAAACRNRTDGGYSDWYMPNTDEWTQLINNRSSITAFTSGYHWSSREWGSNPGWSAYRYYNPTTGSGGAWATKSSYGYSRPVRIGT